MNILASLENNQSFYSIADFFSFVYNVKFHFKRKNSLPLNFISSRRIRVK